MKFTNSDKLFSDIRNLNFNFHEDEDEEQEEEVKSIYFLSYYDDV